MKKYIMTLLYSNMLFSTMSAAAVHADDWIGLEDEPLTLMSYRYYRGQDSSDSHQFSFYHELLSNAFLNLQYNRNKTATDIQDFDYDDIMGQLSWQATDDASVGISYQFQGENDVLEITNLGVSAGYTLKSISFTIEYHDGNFSLFSQNKNNRPRIPDQVDSSWQSQLFSINWSHQNYDFTITHQRFHYQKKLSAINDRPKLQLVLQPGALANIGLFLSDSTSVGVTLYRQQYELSWLLAQSNYEVDDSMTTSLQFDWIQIMSDFNIIYSAGITDESQDNLSFGIGIEWNV